mmetsp:Transcript_52578/g.122986  ORF Transcript_52578/g.122986 Transcript_52578/m.122986 type:complete len:105 (-) Transcript_52578:31-345(-)
MGVINEYHEKRGAGVAKLLADVSTTKSESAGKEPGSSQSATEKPAAEIEDHKAYVEGLDLFTYYRLRSFMDDVHMSLAVVHDRVTKNKEKLGNPRSGGRHNLFQ